MLRKMARQPGSIVWPAALRGARWGGVRTVTRSWEFCAPSARDLEGCLHTVGRHVVNLWPAALLVLLSAFGAEALGLPHGIAWRPYLWTGIVFPAALVFLSSGYWRRWWSPPQRVTRHATAAAGAAALLVALLLPVLDDQRFVSGLAALQLGVIVAITERWGQRSQGAVGQRVTRYIAWYCLLAASWAMAARIVWWAPFEDLAFAANIGLLGLAAGLALPAVWLRPGRRVDGLLGRGLLLAADGLALFIMAMSSMRTDGLGSWLTFYHWGVFVGPAELVQHGGAPLWDVPSQYGFLSTLAIAHWPAPDAWHAFYTLNAVTVFLSAAVLFAFLRTLRGGFLGWLASFLVTLAAIFWLPGWAATLGDPQQYPSVGAFRFLACYLVAGVVLVELSWPAAGSQRRFRAVTCLGCAAWLFGILWSSEIGLYCTVIWLPAYIALVIRRIPNLPRNAWDRLAFAARWLAFPAAVILATIAVVTAWYWMALHHGPDLLSYFDYSLSFQGGFGALPLDPSGPVWVLCLSLGVSACLLGALLRKGLGHAALSAAWAAWAIVFGTASYFVGRSHPSNVTNLAPMMIIAFTLVYHAVRRSGAFGGWLHELRIAALPLAGSFLVATLANWSGLVTYFNSLNLTGWPAHQAPATDPQLLDLMRIAQFKPADDLISRDVILPAAQATDNGVVPLAGVGDPWLPVYPTALLDPLSLEQRAKYVNRFTDRVASSGWLLKDKTADQPDAGTWLEDDLERSFRLTKVFENEHWRLQYFEYVGPKVR